MLKEELLPKHAKPTSALTRGDLLHLRPSLWLRTGVMDGMIRLLNMRQTCIETANPTAKKVLFLDTLFAASLHPSVAPQAQLDRDRLTAMLMPRSLLKISGCRRCAFDQEFVIFTVNLQGVHWITVKLDLTACRISCYDSLEGLQVRPPSLKVYKSYQQVCRSKGPAYHFGCGSPAS